MRAELDALALALVTIACDSAVIDVRACDADERCVELELVELDRQGAAELVVADFDDDGREDILTGAGALIHADGTRRELPSLSFDDHRKLAALDLNLDGHADLLTARSGRLERWLGPELLEPEPLAPSSCGPELRSLTASDLDEDLEPDVILACGDHVEIWWSGARPGASERARVVPDRHARARIGDGAFGLRVDAGDFDGDGHVDLLISGTLEAWLVSSFGARELGALESVGQADPARPWVVGDPDHDGSDEIYGVFPLPGSSLPGVRALAWFWRARAGQEVRYDHSVVPLRSAERGVAIGPLWSEAHDQLMVASEGALGPQLVLDCIDDAGALVSCGRVSLPWSVDAIATREREVVLGSAAEGVWTLTWERRP